MPEMRAPTPRSAAAAVLAAVLAIAAAACSGADSGGSRASGPEIKIGILVPLTGPTKAAGEDALRGALLAADIVNEANQTVPLSLAAKAGLPNLGGATIRLIRSDTKGDGTRAADELGRLAAQENVVAAVGAYDADVTLAASQRAERIQIPFMNGDASAGYLTDRGLDWFFRVGPTDRMYGETFFSTLRYQERLDKLVRKIVVFYAGDKSGSAVAADMDELAGEGGFTVADRVRFDPGATDLAAPARQVKAAKPDAVFAVASTAESAAAIVEAFRRINYTPPAVMGGGPGFTDPSFVDRVGANAAGLLKEAGWSSDLASRNPAAKIVKDMFAKKYSGSEMTDISAGSFTAVMTMAQAINNAGSVEPDKIRSALLSLDIPGRDTIVPWDGIQFDATNQNSSATGVVEQLVSRGGTLVSQVVYPTDVAKGARLIWPMADARR
jgi:branched-chain amino acid transport system substrate-binding protein